MALPVDEFVVVRRAEIRDALKSDASTDLTALLHKLPGYWPVDVVDDLKRLTASGSTCGTAAEKLLSQLAWPASDPDFGDQVRRTLPIPHPLDADWRFTVRTRDRILDLAASLSPRQETLLLGTPSIFAHLCDQLDLRPAVLIDANKATVDAANELARDHDLLSARHANLLGATEIALRPIFDTAIADPPWYSAEYRSFLDTASDLLAVGGILLMAAAPRGTRPSAEADRAELIRHATDAGFDLIDTFVHELEYTSPPFERAALRESGLPGIPTNWRRADLLILKKSRRSRTDPQTKKRTPSHWIARTMGRCRLMVRPDDSRSRSGDLHGRVCKSVSRLDPERELANLWTSGNAAFKVFGDLMTEIVDKNPWPKNVAAKALLAQLESEQADLRDWGWL